MLYSRLSRLKHLEDADLEAHGQVVLLRVQYAANGDEPPVWGPTYTYLLPSGGLVEEEATQDET
jgi:hypothetical protein